MCGYFHVSVILILCSRVFSRWVGSCCLWSLLYGFIFVFRCALIGMFRLAPVQLAICFVYMDLCDGVEQEYWCSIGNRR